MTKIIFDKVELNLRLEKKGNEEEISFSGVVHIDEPEIKKFFNLIINKFVENETIEISIPELNVKKLNLRIVANFDFNPNNRTVSIEGKMNDTLTSNLISITISGKQAEIQFSTK